MKDEKLIEYLKNRRLDLGLSLRDVAQIAGVNASTVKRWEDGRIEDMKRDKIEGYAKALHIPPAVIMGWQAPPANRFSTHNKKDPRRSESLWGLINDSVLQSTC